MAKEPNKRALNTRSGRITYIPSQIYNNPFRMRNGNWQLIEEPPTTDQQPVSANMPAIEFKEPEPYIAPEQAAEVESKPKPKTKSK